MTCLLCRCHPCASGGARCPNCWGSNGDPQRNSERGSSQLDSTWQRSSLLSDAVNVCEY